MTFHDALTTILLSSALILLMIAAVVIVVIMSSRQKVKQLMNIATLQLNYEKELRAAEYEMQEATMNAIGRDLHDNIGQMLSLLKIQIESSRLSNPASEVVLSPLDDTLMNIHEQLRSLSKTLSSDAIYHQGILFAMNRDIEKLCAYSAFKIVWENDNAEPQLNDDERLMAYRIFQELIQNIIKHAEATTVRVKLAARPYFSFTISDDGKGFEYEKAIENGGSGIRNIFKRASMAGFICSIDSAKGKGTTISLNKPEIKN